MEVLKQFELINLYIYIYIGFVLRALGPLEPCSTSAKEFVEMQNLRPYPKPRNQDLRFCQDPQAMHVCVPVWEILVWGILFC